MLDKQLVKEKMEERGFTVYCTIGGTKIQFVSERMYDFTYENRVPKRNRVPVINIIVDLENGEFQCFYNLSKSLSQLTTPKCSPVMDDDHFNKIVCKFESEATWLSRLTD